MQKETAYLFITIIICLTLLGIGGEYFMYRYYATNTQSGNQMKTTPQITGNQNQTPAPIGQGSPENSITSFNFKNPMAVGSIDEAKHAVIITVPPFTSVLKLVPTIEISKDAIASPSSGSEQDFMNPVTYTVTAQNGSVKKYTVTVTVASSIQSIEKLITAFSLAGFNPMVSGFISNESHTVYVIVPDGTDTTRLIPTIKVSVNATVFPKSGTTQDFTNPVTYTVTDVYGGTQDYTVTVVTESNSG